MKRIHINCACKIVQYSISEKVTLKIQLFFRPTHGLCLIHEGE